MSWGGAQSDRSIVGKTSFAQGASLHTPLGIVLSEVGGVQVPYFYHLSPLRSCPPPRGSEPFPPPQAGYRFGRFLELELLVDPVGPL